MATIAQVMYPEEAAFQTTAFPQFVRNNGTNYPITGLAFDAAASEYGYLKFSPLGYGSGNLTLDVMWYADTATTGVVRWEAALAAITPDTDTQDAETKAFATATALDDTHLGTVAQRIQKATLVITNLDSIVVGDECWLRVGRLGAHANDTMAGDAIMVSARLSYSDV